jgi:V/A-type H+-transporting ATPase subunit A
VAALAELIGASALPDSEQIALLAGRLIREGVLQQSAVSTNDAFCGLEKQAALADAVLAVVDTCQSMVAAGVPAAAIRDHDFSPLLRAAAETGPDDADGVRAQRDITLDGLKVLR